MMIALWSVLVVYGVLMWLISPRVRRPDQFFQGRDPRGGDVGPVFLTASVIISWIFAKSITNAANLGYNYGLVGAVAYAGWYLSIPVAGFIIYRIRTSTSAPSLATFLTSRYGRGATLAFMLVVLVRLGNEVWSNTAVVGAYFGASGTAAYFVGALAFTAVTLAYSLRGGLRSSILTDVFQLGLGLFLLVFVLALILPRSGGSTLLATGSWSLAGGVDLLLVAILQSLSYPFHDPVLTDRGFLTSPRVMLKSYIVAGIVAAAFIVLFGLVGVYGRIVGLQAGQDTPLRVAEAFGVAFTAVMTVLMMVSAGSTLDSTLSSFSRAVVVDLGGGPGVRREEALSRRFAGWLAPRNAIVVGRTVMILAAGLGSVPLFTGAAILKATTISGTMVLGLAPPFLLFAWRWPGRLAFHLGFWPGMAAGILYAANAVPGSWNVGGGPHAALLGANLYGTAVSFGGFAVGAVVDRIRSRPPGLS